MDIKAILGEIRRSILEELIFVTASWSKPLSRSSCVMGSSPHAHVDGELKTTTLGHCFSLAASGSVPRREAHDRAPCQWGSTATVCAQQIAKNSN